jgi:hypothetical protein
MKSSVRVRTSWMVILFFAIVLLAAVFLPKPSYSFSKIDIRYGALPLMMLVIVDGLFLFSRRL